MSKKFLNLFLILLLFLTITTPVFAQGSLSPWICNPLLANCIQASNPKVYTNSVLSVVFSIFFIVGIIYFIWSMISNAYHLLSNQGDSKVYETAKNGITHGLIGIAVIFSIFAIIKTAGYIFGITGLDTLTIVWPHL